MFLLTIKNLTSEDVFLPEFNAYARVNIPFEVAREDEELDSFECLENLAKEGKIVMSAKPLKDRVPCWTISA